MNKLKQGQKRENEKEAERERGTKTGTEREDLKDIGPTFEC